MLGRRGSLFALLRHRRGCRTIVRHPRVVSGPARGTPSRRAARCGGEARHRLARVRRSSRRFAHCDRSRPRDGGDRSAHPNRTTRCGGHLRSGRGTDATSRSSRHLPARHRRGVSRRKPHGVPRSARGGTAAPSSTEIVLRHVGRGAHLARRADGGTADPHQGRCRRLAASQGAGVRGAPDAARTSRPVRTPWTRANGRLLRRDRLTRTGWCRRSVRRLAVRTRWVSMRRACRAARARRASRSCPRA